MVSSSGCLVVSKAFTHSLSKILVACWLRFNHYFGRCGCKLSKMWLLQLSLPERNYRLFYKTNIQAECTSQERLGPAVVTNDSQIPVASPGCAAVHLSRWPTVIHPPPPWISRMNRRQVVGPFLLPLNLCWSCDLLWPTAYAGSRPSC